MLCRVAIANFAVIDKAEITLENGFTALTGETGAGKSLIMDAITMVLGGRMGRDSIRAGAKCAVAEAAFFGDHPLADETGMLLLRRELYTDGRNLCSINGEMTTVAGLRAAGESLLAIHGQHDTEQLLHKSYHLAFLDAFARTEAEKKAYETEYTEKKALEAEISSLMTDDGEKQRRLEMLRFWIDEIEAAALVPGEEEELSQKRDALRHIETIRQSAQQGYAALCGEEGGARDALSHAARVLDNAAQYDTRLKSAAEKVRDALYQTEEIADLLRDIGEEETDGEALEAVEERLDTIHKFKSKYGKTIEDILSYYEEISEEAEKIETGDQKLAELNRRLAETEKRLALCAEALSEKRKAAGEEIAKLVVKELAALDMEKVRFCVQVEGKDYGPLGADAVEFFISTNPMEGVKPLAKIASGGELSRVCLALQTVLALHSDMAPGTMIFDEIDTGISGRAAQKVGEKLRSLAEKKQILCVTHLPQMAAKADAQFKIEKQAIDGGFSTRVLPLSKEERIREIAGMIGGDFVTEKTLLAAEEMLK